ncbi:hypothetical protein LCGC14_0651940 [marine sediment metagenome]|uniref:Uncharacterized protein n=1 Tax=marine sediment metagenome TaxID=412755 RepID=A0A0F9THP0_9ZZZZ
MKRRERLEEQPGQKIEGRLKGLEKGLEKLEDDKMVRITKSIFFPPKDKALARKISIKSPTAFRRSIRKLRLGGITLKERRALTLAKTRATVQLKRNNLSSNERRQFRSISQINIPKVTKKR